MNKHFDMDEATEAYLRDIGVQEPVILKQLREKTAAVLGRKSVMLSDPATCQLLKSLIVAYDCQVVVELGVFTGYSTLWMAEGLSDTGKVIACDTNQEWLAIGQAFWQAAGVADKVEVRVGPGLETMETLINEGIQADMIYLDANKDQYPEYGRIAKNLLRPGGLLVVDNTFFAGKVLDVDDQNTSTEGVRALNMALALDQDFEVAPLPMSDGVTLAVKKRGLHS